MDGGSGRISHSSSEKVALDAGSGSDVTVKPTCCRRFLSVLRKNLLLILLVLAIAAGIGIGAGIRSVDPPFTAKQIMYFRFPGDILMRMLKMLILPLIVCTLVAGLASLDARASGKMGLRAVVYYFSTTLIAVILGMVLVSAIRPGAQSQVTVTGGEAKVVNTADAFLDLIRNCFPDNIVVAAFKQTTTTQVPRIVQRNVTIEPGVNSTAEPRNETIDVTEYDAVTGLGDGMNVLGLVVFSIALGLVISKMGAQGEMLAQFFEAMGEATMRLVAIVICITATVASIGAAGVPQAGLVTMLIVLTAVGLPTEDVTKILAVDWLLDRFRTTINVMGDAIGAGVVEHLSRRELRKISSESGISESPDVDMVDGQKPEQNGDLAIDNQAFSPIDAETTTTPL